MNTILLELNFASHFNPKMVVESMWAHSQRFVIQIHKNKKEISLQELQNRFQSFVMPN